MKNELHIEHRFDLSAMHPGLFGTCDALVWNPRSRLLSVFDYKHGAGLYVDVYENPQLMYYALGALISSGYNAAEVELVIVQPRHTFSEEKVRRWRFSSLELVDFAADLIEAAKATEQPDAPLVVGDHCRKHFCPAQAICPAQQAHRKAIAKLEFAPAVGYDPAELASILDGLPVLEAWIKSVREFAYAEADHGRPPPGYKLVEKQARRQWKHEDSVVAELVDLTGMSANCFTEKPSPLSPAQVEKVLGKKNYLKLADPMVHSVSSGYTLVHESDKRTAVRLDALTEFGSAS
jgi:hypothetical protein